MTPDVLVCGAGPAGAAAALVLGRAGARVLVLDRARFPRDKLCGDTLNPGALAVLARLGIAHVAEQGLPIAGMIVTGQPACQVAGRYGDRVTGRSLPRTRLDAALVAEVAQHAVVDDGVVVRGPLVNGARMSGVVVAGRDGRDLPIRAAMTIAADGGRSRLARAFGLSRHPAAPRRWAVGAYFEGVRDLSDCGEMHIRRGGYIGVAPLPGGLANACVVSSDRAALAAPGALLERTLATDPLLAARFAAARRVTAVQVLGPLAVETSGAGAPGLLLAGDAAGFIDPMTGDGLRFALRGGELAAEYALIALATGNDDVHLRLAEARRAVFARKWRFDRALRLLVGSPFAIQAAARGARLAPGWLRHAIRYAGDLRAA